jgi:hypothetical protein
MGKGEIDENILLKLLGENQLLESPSIIYNKWHLIKKSDVKNSHHDLDRSWQNGLPPLWMKVWQNGNVIKPRFYNAWQTNCV